MKKLIAVLLLLILGESAYAEFVTILPVNSKMVASASSEIVTLSELYGKTTTIRFMTESSSPEFIALNNTNISPTDSLTLTEDVLLDNKLFGFYLGASRQTREASAPGTAVAAMAMSFTDSEADYQALINKARAEAGSNIALAQIIEEQINRTSDSQLLSLDTDLENENSLLDDDRTTSLMDTILPGSGSSQSSGYDLPISDNNILVSGIGGSILNGGGTGTVGGGGFGFADGGSSVPEPSTWALLVLSVMGLAIYRKRIAR